ncbi:hypothetical protein QL285_065883 [Trifolium repens]|nr:hypothetical protein QL285_065883 [Trifolium repens]
MAGDWAKYPRGRTWQQRIKNSDPNNIEPGSREAPEGVSQPGSFGNWTTLNLKQDVHFVPDSPMLETTSSFGSTSSSPSLANLPPIRVHVEDGGSGGVGQKVLGIEEHFAQMGVVVGGVGQKQQDEGFAVISSPPLPLFAVIIIIGMKLTSCCCWLLEIFWISWGL